MRQLLAAMVGLVWLWAQPGVAESLDWLPSDARINTNAAGDTTSADSHVAAEGAKVYVVWEDERNGNEDVYLNYSTNGGETWLGTDIRINKNAAGASRSMHPQVAVSGPHVYVVWMDTRNGTTDIYLNYSSNGGQSWQASDVRLDTDAPGAAWSYTPLIVASGTNAWVIWREARSSGFNNMDIYLNRTSSGGASWLSTDVRVDSGLFDVLELGLAAYGSNVTVVWEENQNIYFQSSADSGVSWLPADVKVNHNTTGECWAPRMTVSGSNVYITWRHYYNFSNKVYFNRSTDYGESWEATDAQIDFGGSPEIAAFESAVYLLYSNSDQLLLQRSLDGGGTWEAGVAVVRPYNVNNYSLHSLGVSGPVVYAAWREARCGDLSIVANHSADGGVSFEPIETFINDTGCTGTANADDPQLAVSTYGVFVSWDEARSGPRDVFVNAAKSPLIFADGFETGTTSAWSTTAGGP